MQAKVYMKTKENSFYRQFFSLYISLVLQNVVTLSVNLTDNVMLGAYSETSLAGVAAANQIQFIYQMLIFAFGEGMVILGSQYWGKRQTKSMKKLAAIMMQHGLAVMVLLFVLISLFPEYAIGLFTTDGAIILEGAGYLYLIRFTYLFFAVTQLLLAVLRSMQIVKIALYLSAMTFFVNCGINYVLIFGKFGMPELVHHCINNQVILNCQRYPLISPLKGLCHKIVLFNKTQDACFQFINRFIALPFEQATVYDAEPDLDLVHP